MKVHYIKEQEEVEVDQELEEEVIVTIQIWQKVMSPIAEEDRKNMSVGI